MNNSLIKIPAERIERAIYQIRGERVILDSDLAAIYGVTTKRLNEQVKRNKKRFPGDFVFQLTENEFEAMRSQFATSKQRRLFEVANCDLKAEPWRKALSTKRIHRARRNHGRKHS